MSGSAGKTATAWKQYDAVSRGTSDLPIDAHQFYFLYSTRSA